MASDTNLAINLVMNSAIRGADFLQASVKKSWSNGLAVQNIELFKSTNFTKIQNDLTGINKRLRQLSKPVHMDIFADTSKVMAKIANVPKGKQIKMGYSLAPLPTLPSIAGTTRHIKHSLAPLPTMPTVAGATRHINFTQSPLNLPTSHTVKINYDLPKLPTNSPNHGGGRGGGNVPSGTGMSAMLFNPATAVIAGAGYAGARLIAPSIDKNSAMVDFSLATDYTGKEAISKAQEIINSMKSYSIKEVSVLDMASQFGRSGIKDTNVITSALKTTIEGAKAFGLADYELPTFALKTGQMMAAYNLNMKSLGTLFDRVNYVADNGAIVERDLMQFMQISSGLKNDFSRPQIMTLGASMLELGKAPAEIQTFLKTMSARMKIALTPKALEAMELAGVDWSGFKDKMKLDPLKGIKYLMSEYREATKLDSDLAESAFKEFIGLEHLSNWKSLAVNPQLVNKNESNALSDQIHGSRLKAYELTTTTTQHRIDKLNKSFNSLSITMGNHLLPNFDGVLSSLTFGLDSLNIAFSSKGWNQKFKDFEKLLRGNLVDSSVKPIKSPIVDSQLTKPVQSAISFEQIAKAEPISKNAPMPSYVGNEGMKLFQPKTKKIDFADFSYEGEIKKQQQQKVVEEVEVRKQLMAIADTGSNADKLTVTNHFHGVQDSDEIAEKIEQSIKRKTQEEQTATF